MAAFKDYIESSAGKLSFNLAAGEASAGHLFFYCEFILTLQTLIFKSADNTDNTQNRIDSFMARQLALSRSKIQAMIKEGKVQVNGKLTRASQILEENDIVSFEAIVTEEAQQLLPHKMPLDIIYEDSDVIVVNKPAGISVHPGSAKGGVTLVEGVLHHCGSLSKLYAKEDPLRPGVVHRLDADTTGLIVFAKRDDAHEKLQEQFKQKSNLREYKALVYGKMPKRQITMESYLYRDPVHRLRFKTLTLEEFTRLEPTLSAEDRQRYRYAKSEFFCQATYLDAMTSLRVRLHTGRTHQIRIHCKALHMPVVGDLQYPAPRMLPASFPDEMRKLIADQRGQLLHAATLGFDHPGSGERLQFEVKEPANFLKIMQLLEPFAKKC